MSNKFINTKLTKLYKINDETYKKWCLENKLNITNLENRNKYVKGIIYNDYKI